MLNRLVEFLDNWVFDHSKIQPNKQQRVKTRLQVDLYCLVVNKNTNKGTLDYAGGEKSLNEKMLLFFVIYSFFLRASFFFFTLKTFQEA